jgi:hypothetical protein
MVIYATNHAIVAFPIICSSAVPGATANVTGLYQGLQKLQFVQASYDSLIGQYFEPVTNTYSAVFVTNYVSIRQTFQRVVTSPDMVFSAADLTFGPGGVPVIPLFDDSEPAYSKDPASVYRTAGGPGVINPGGGQVTFNKVGPVYYNQSPTYLNGTNYGRDFLYGSFDGTTNTPVVYPDANSLARLAAAELIQVLPGAPGGLPSGRTDTNAPAYNASITASGGQAPYIWSLTVGQLPNGLSLTNIANNCVISGRPTKLGTFYFTIQMTDSSASVNTLNLDYYITITN